MSLLVIAAIFALAGFVKGVIGLGLPTIAMGLLALLMPPLQAAALLVLPSIATNIMQIAGPGLAVLLRRLWPMLLALAVGTLAAGGWMAAGKTAGLVLGLALVAYATVGLLHWRLRLPAAAEHWAGPLAGLLTGLLTGATGIFVIPSVPYLQAIGLERDALVRALGLTFLTATLALGANVAQAGALRLDWALGVALLAALGGMVLGSGVRGRLDPAGFRRWFFLGLLALGAWLAVRAVT